jgi:two-component system, cell cycle sensor histidine kinase and response regulator CckA
MNRSEVTASSPWATPTLIRKIDRLFARLPKWLRGYVVVLTALICGCLIALLLLHTFGLKSRIFISLLGDVILLGAAWTGYGPGLLTLALIRYVVPLILLPGQPLHVDLGQSALLSVISLLVSRIASSKRQTEASLRSFAEQLEARVQERTQELQRNEQKRAWLAAMVESSDDAIIGNTLDGSITSWNRGAEALFGYRSDEAIGRSMAILIPSESSIDLPSILSRIRNGSIVQHLETVRLRKDGSRIEVSLTISPVRDLDGAVHGASTIARDITAQRLSNQALEESEHRYRLLFHNNPQSMWVYDQETLAFLMVNETAVRSYGYSREEFLQMDLTAIRPEEDVHELLESTAVPTTGFNQDGPWRHRKKDGQIISVEIAAHPIVWGERPACLVLATDVTERIRLEEQFRQAQRLESVGRLAGGVAHDFNNLLTVIIGYAEMLLVGADKDEGSKEAVNQILQAGERAAELTRQLLAFSRKQVIEPSVINMNTIIGTTQTFLRRLIGEDIELVTRLDADLGLVLADPGQIHQIVMNLAINSRDAMPNGGSLHIETSNVDLDDGYRDEHTGVQPGPYVMLAISDSGCGISPEIRSRIFEPFFTTKELGKGTGLGLATVYGMVKQSGGWIWVYSEPGRGTTFKIYFPRTDEPFVTSTRAIKTNVTGNETVLVVEDQTEVRALALAGLASFGYSVHGSATGEEALAFCRDFHDEIHVVVTDVVMPDMNGKEVARQFAQLRPQTRILFMSGYTSDVIAHRGVLEGDVDYMQKPFTPETLARKIREILAAD